jgi:hypothetical protein
VYYIGNLRSTNFRRVFAKSHCTPNVSIPSTRIICAVISRGYSLLIVANIPFLSTTTNESYRAHNKSKQNAEASKGYYVFREQIGSGYLCSLYAEEVDNICRLMKDLANMSATDAIVMFSYIPLCT